MSFDYQRWLKQCHEGIQSGKAHKVKKQFQKIKVKSIPRVYRQPMAEMARRLNLIELGLKIMNPLIHSDKELLQPAGAEEQITYSALLIRIGALKEALQRLQSVPVDENPRAYLFLAHVYAGQWQYSLAWPYLELYQEKAHLDEYQKTLNQLNMASCLVSLSKPDQAIEMLNQVVEVCQKNAWNLVWGNALEVMGQIYLAQYEFQKSREHLILSSQKLAQTGSRTEFFTRKWMAINNLMEYGERHLTDIKLIQSEAVERKHWETLRECDLYKSIVFKDEELFLNVYFATPYESYRQRMLWLFPKKVNVPQEHKWKFYPKSKTQVVVRVSAGELENGESLWNFASLHHKLICTLSRDLYAPCPVGALSSALYPGEYWDPYHSMNKTKVAITRFREWAREKDFPLVVKNHSRSFRLEASSGVELILNQEVAHENQWMKGREYQSWQKLKKKWPQHSFTAREASSHLSLSKRSVNLLFKKGLEQGLLESTGNGKFVTYHFK